MSDAQLVMLVPTAEERSLQPHLDQPINAIMVSHF